MVNEFPQSTHALPKSLGHLRFYAASLEYVTDAVLLLDVDFCILACNQSALTMFGWEREKVLGECVAGQLFSESKLSTVWEELDKNGRFHHIKQQVTQDGQLQTLETAFHILEDGDDQQQAIVAVSQQIASTDKSENKLADRKITEQALSLNEAHYRTIIENFPNGMVALYDKELRYTVVGGKGLDATGLTAKDLLGQKLRDIFPPEIYERDEPAMLAALNGETVSTVVSFGTEYFNVMTLPVKDDNDQVISGLVLSQNVTTLKRAEYETRQTLKQLHLAIETAKLGIWQLNIQSGHLAWNDELLAIYGISREAFETNLNGWQKQVHPEDSDYANQRLAKAFEGESVYDVGFRIIRPSGEVRYLNASASPVYDDEGDLVELIGINVDVTNVKEQEDALQENEAYLRAIFENSLNAIMVADDKGTYLTANPAAAKMFGVEIDQLIGMNVREIRTLTTPTSTEQYQTYLKKRQEIGQFEFLRPTGEHRIAQYYAVRIDKNFNLSILADVTESVHSKQALERYVEQLRIFREIDKTLLSDLSSEKMLEQTLQKVAMLVRANRIDLLILADKTIKMGRVLADYPTGTSAHTQYPQRLWGDIVNKLERGQVIHIANLRETHQHQPAFESYLQDNAITLLFVPLLAGKKLIGMLSFSRQQYRPFSAEEIEQAIEVAAPLAVTLRQMSLIEQIQKQTADLEQRVLERTRQLEEAHAVEQERTRKLAILEERNRLARDLHDAVSQTLWSATIIADVLPTLWEQDREKGVEKLARLHTLTKGALAEMRTLLVELRPETLLANSLKELIRRLADATTSRTRAKIQLTLEGECVLPEDVHISFYRIAQESLNNVVRHSIAHEVSIVLICDVDSVELMVKDDGCGFDPHQLLSGEHLGLKIMQERAEQIGAQLLIQSQIDEGTTVEVMWQADKEDII